MKGYFKIVIGLIGLLSFTPTTHAAEAIKGLYLNAFSLKGPRFNDAIKIIKQTELNALVVDVKDVRGFLVYQSKTAKRIIPTAIRKNAYKKLETLVDSINKHGIYSIARVVVFKDNYYPEYYPFASIKTRNNRIFAEKGLKWIDPHNKEYWKYILSIVRECYKAGFDEVQLDYIRFPGTKIKLFYPHKKDSLEPSEVIGSFAKYIRNNIRDYRSRKLSLDVFGLAGNISGNDLGIGQIWEQMAPHVDVMSPMMYPSHYPRNFAGIKFPDLEPFKIVKESVSRSIRTNNKSSSSTIIRPWIQAFTAKWLAKHVDYNSLLLLQQVQALKSEGIKGYLVWHPGSKYRKFYPQVFRNSVNLTKEKQKKKSNFSQGGNES